MTASWNATERKQLCLYYLLLLGLPQGKIAVFFWSKLLPNNYGSSCLFILEEEIDGISKVKIMDNVVQKEQLYRDTEGVLAPLKMQK